LKHKEKKNNNNNNNNNKVEFGLGISTVQSGYSSTDSIHIHSITKILFKYYYHLLLEFFLIINCPIKNAILVKSQPILKCKIPNTPIKALTRYSL